MDQSRKPSTRVRLQWILRTAIASAVLGAVLGGAAYLLADEVAVLPAEVQAAMLVGGATFAVVFVAGTARALLLYRSWEYVVREDSLYLSRGVFTRVRTIVPYVRVQHIDTQRNPVERVLGLSTLVVYTAGSRGADVTIPGLTPERASELQTRLKVLAIESEEEDAV
ncbi:MAG: PH domain-containing protein [Haloarculaceae archaeon]